VGSSSIFFESITAVLSATKNALLGDFPTRGGLTSPISWGISHAVKGYKYHGVKDADRAPRGLECAAPEHYSCALSMKRDKNGDLLLSITEAVKSALYPRPESNLESTRITSFLNTIRKTRHEPL
jgi:hypothetical protein